MRSELVLLPSSRAVRLFDVAAAVIVVAFAVLAGLAAARLWGVADLSDNLLEGAGALEQTARVIARVGDVPVIGNGADQLADSMRGTAVELRTSAESLRGNVRGLAVLVGVAILAIPVLPLSLLYLPARLARLHELRELRRALEGPDADPLVTEYLARAALRRIPYSELRRISAWPWRDVEHGHHRHLAAAELRRLGIRPPAWQDPVTSPRDG